MADVTERLLSLLSLLQNGRAITGRDLTERLQISARTLRRDVDRLRSYGYSIETRSGPHGHYRLTDGQALPPLLLDDDEALATALALTSLAATSPGIESTASDGLDQAAERALAKLDLITPAHLRHRIAALRESLEASPQLAPNVDIGHLLTLTEATAAQLTVGFSYSDSNGALTKRRVEPHNQVHHQLRWYLIGWDLDRNDWRTFRLDRMAQVKPSGHRFNRRRLPTDTATELLRAGVRRKQQRVRIVVEAPPAQVIPALSYRDVEVEKLETNRSAIELWVETWEWLAVLLAQLDAPFTIAEPAEIAAKCHDFGRRLTAGDANEIDRPRNRRGWP